MILGLGTLVVPLDSALNVAFPAMVRHFAVPMPAIQWVVISYTLVHATLMLACGRLGDLFGYRGIFLAGTACSTVAFAACTFAPDYGWLLAARMLQGAGGALLLSCGPALATSLFPESHRARVLGLYTMLFGIGSALGPALAGDLLARWGWSSVFAFRVPLALLAFLLGWCLPRRPGGAGGGFDGIGAALLIVAMTAALLGLPRLQDLPQSWPAVAGCTVLSGLAGWGFVRHENRIPAPLIALRVFRDGRFRLVNAAYLLMTLAGFSVLLLVPFYLARTTDLSLRATGWLLAASPAGIMLAAPFAGRLAARFSPRRVALLGLLAVSAGLAGIGCSGSVAVLTLSMAIQGVGNGLFQVAYFDIVTATIPRADRGVAGSLAMLTRTLGIVSGASILLLTLQWTGGDTDFRTAFARTFLIAALIPLAMAIPMLRR